MSQKKGSFSTTLTLIGLALLGVGTLIEVGDTKTLLYGAGFVVLLGAVVVWLGGE